MLQGYELDARSVRELRKLRLLFKSQTITPPAPQQRMKTREIGGSGVKQYIVAALPAAVAGVVPSYVIAHSHNNGSTGTMNVSIGVTIPHSVGDKLYAQPVSSNAWGLTYQGSNGSTAAITVQETGCIFGTPIRVAVVPGSTGTCNVSIGSFASQQYDVYNNTSSSVKLASNLVVTESRLIAGPCNQASNGTICVGNGGAFVLLRVEETFGGCAE